MDAVGYPESAPPTLVYWIAIFSSLIKILAVLP